MKLTKKSETSSKITFTYDKPTAETEGYIYYANDVAVSRTFNPDDLEVTFGKVPSGRYAVDAIGFEELDRAEWPEVTIPPPPTGELPFQEAQLRAGYKTVTTADIPVGAGEYRIPTNDDYLIDLGWVKRDRALKIYTRPGQRVHTKNVYIDVTIQPASGSSAYGRSGFGYRPLSGSAAPADHLSLTGCLITGPTMGDGMTFGDSGSSSNNALLVTNQRVRIESRSSVLGRQIKPVDEPAGEHYDGFHMQGPCSRMQFGLCTIMAADCLSPLHPGKGMMLNAYGPTNNAYTLELNQVNFADDAFASAAGAFIMQDFRSIKIDLTDVYGLKQGGGGYQWASGSGLWSMHVREGGSYEWTSSGSKPNRVGTFAAGNGWTGQVREGRSPDGQDFCTRADLGL